VRWATVLRLYRRRLKETLAPELLALLGIAVGVALLYASQVAGTTLSGSAARLATDVLGPVRLQLLSRSPQGMDQSMVARVRALPGVRVADPVVEMPANVIGARGSDSVQLVGLEPAATKISNATIRRFSNAQLEAQEAIAVPSSVMSKIGSGTGPVTLQIAGQRRETLIGMKIGARENALVASSPLVVAPLQYAQRLAGIGHRVTRIFLTPRQGQEGEVKRELRGLAGDSLNVRPAAFDATLFEQAATPIQQSTTLFAAISALVGLAFAAYAMLLTVPYRRGMVDDLRMLGYSSGEIVKVLAVDALILGVLASLLGLLVGELLSALLLHADPGYLVFAFPVATQRHVTASDLVLSIAAAMLAAFGGVFLPMRRQLFGRFQRRGGEHAEMSVHRNIAALAGLACLALTTAVLYLAPQLALLGMASLTLAVLLILPLTMDGVVAVCARVRRRILAATLRIAIVNLQYPSNRVRSLAIAATGAIAVFGAVAIGGARENLQRGLNNSSMAFNDVGRLWVAPAGAYDLFTTTPIGAKAAAGIEARLQGLRGVQSVAAYRGSYLDIGTRRTWVLAPPLSTATPISATQLVEGSVVQATRLFRAGGWMVVSQALASERDLHVGSRFTLPTPVPTMLRVAAIGTNMGWPPGALIMNADDYAHAWGSTAPSAFLVTPEPDVTLAEAQAQVRTAIGPHSGVAVETAEGRIDRGHLASHAGLVQLSQIADLVLAAAVLAMAAAMSTLIWQRRPQLAQQQVEGKYRTTLWVALLIETSLLLGTGCMTGAAIGIYGQLLLSHALATVTGFPVVISAGGLVALISFGVVTAAAVAVVAVPGYFAARVRPSILFAD
jgi:putative ABC transport system permease protein